MSCIIYCGVCTMPTEYCRYNPNYDQCLAWMKTNQPQLFAIEVKDISENNPKIAEKVQHLWNEQTSIPPDDTNETKSNHNSIHPHNDPKQTKPAIDLAQQILNLQQQITFETQFKFHNLGDIQEDEEKIWEDGNEQEEHGLKSILKNPQNPNYDIEKQRMEEINKFSKKTNADDLDEHLEDMNDYGLGKAGNRNKARGPPPIIKTKCNRKKGKDTRGFYKRTVTVNQWRSDSDTSSPSEEYEDKKHIKRVRFEELPKHKKMPKGIVEVSLENRKGKKKVTVVRGYLEKSQFKNSQIKSAFKKRFSTSVNITYQDSESNKGPKQVVLMGDKRYDFMKYLKQKFPNASELLYYKTEEYGLFAAVDQDYGVVVFPP